MRLIALSGLLAAAVGVGTVLLAPVVDASPRPSISSVRSAPLAPPARHVLSAAESREAAAAGLVPSGTRSVLNTAGPLHFGRYVWDANGVPPGSVTVSVDLSRQLISVFRSGHEIGSAVITFGASGHDTPLGTFPVLAKMQSHHSATYDAPMPYTLRLTADGVSIHGSSVRWGAATHGCIGVPDGFARLLFDEVKVGQPIVIRSSSA